MAKSFHILATVDISDLESFGHDDIGRENLVSLFNDAKCDKMMYLMETMADTDMDQVTKAAAEKIYQDEIEVWDRILAHLKVTERVE